MRITLGRTGWRTALLASTALLSAPAVHGQTLVRWDGLTSTDWFTASNWFPAGVPGSNSVVVIDKPNPVVIAAPGAQVGFQLDVGFVAANVQLTIQGGGTLIISAKTNIAASSSATGGVTVTGVGSTWTSQGQLVVGTGGQGRLTIEAGGSVMSSQSTIGLGAAAGGEVTVSGVGSMWITTGDLVVADTGFGMVTIQAGGAVSNAGSVVGNQEFAAIGRVTVSGAGSTWTSSGNLVVGNFGDGAVRIEAGGKVSNALGVLASETKIAAGAVTVTGPGSTWTNSDGLIVGGFGRGTLTISNGGAVGNTFGIIGNKDTSVSTATITGAGSTWTNGGDLVVGNFGSGTLRIENGGKVSNALGILASETAAAAGAITVTGPGSTWTNGSVIVGGIGRGTLTISNGGAVSAATFSIIGNRESSVSTATVSGAGATWTNTGDFVVGNFGDGTLRIESGGTVTNDGISFIGRRANAKGAGFVAGTGSTWTSDFLVVGDEGNGALTVSDGGKVSGGAGRVGAQAGGSGTVTIRGAGATWANTGDLIIGHSSTGTLSVSDSGAVSSSLGALGAKAGVTGTATISGAGSTWTLRILDVGQAGTGILTVSDGGMVQAKDAVRVALEATSRGFINIGAAEGTAAVTPGTLQAASLAFGDGIGALVLNHTGTNYAFTTPITGSGTIRQLAGVTALTADSVTFSGTTAVVGGTLHVDGTLGGSVTVGAAGTLGGIGTVVGPVTVDGVLAAGKSPGTLRVGTLTLNAGSTSRFELNTPGVAGGNDPVTGNDLVVVSGNLTLGGTLDARAAAGGFYTLFTYGGTLSGSFVSTTVTGTGGFTVASGTVQPNIAGQISLAVLGVGQGLQFWDGADTAGNGIVDGGAGTWSAAGTNWTGQPGQATTNNTWGGSIGVFAGAAGGGVTVAGTQAFDTLQFSTNGYTLSGGILALSPASGAAGTITVDTGISATIATPLADGSGNGLLKVGGGTLTLSGANTYSGDTIVSAGTLALGAGGSIAASRAVRLGAAGAALDITAGGNQTVQNLAGVAGATVALGANTLTVTSSSDTMFAGMIGGTGGLIKAGTGTLTLSGTNSYTGGTTINAGTLQLGDGGTSGAITGTITNNATLAVNRSDTVTVDGVISGTGGLRQIGPGTTTLTAISTYSGPTSVEDGRLVVNGSIANSTVTITGGRLGGSGTIGGIIVASGGTVAPGNSIGTMNVADNISFAAGSTYDVEIEPGGTSDLLHATGTATLSGGTVSIVKAPGTYTAGTRYTILTADAGVAGTFAGFTQDLPFISLALAYDPTNVFLDVTRNIVAFCDVAATRNECAAGRGAESLAAGNPLYDAIASLPDTAAARQAFNALSGEIHASTRTALIEDSHHLRDAVIARTRLAGITAAAPQFAALAQATDQNQRPQDGTAITAWMQGFGALARSSGNGNAASLKRTTGGVVVGADARFDDTWTIGLATGYSRTNLDVNARASRADIDSYHLALYGGAQFGPLGVRAGVSHTWHSIDSTRRIAFPGFADTALADYKARTTQIFGDVGYALALGSVAVEPFANLAWVHVSTNRFGETGGIAALHARGGSDSSLFSTLGVRAAAQVWNDDNKTLTLRGSLGWRHAFGDVTPAARLAFAGGTSFGIEGVPIARDAAVIEAGFDLKIGKALTVGAGYAGVIASGARDHAFKGTITFRF